MPKRSSKLTEKIKKMQQVPFRLHINDHAELKSKLALEKMKIQTLVEACVLAYLDGDDHIKTIARDHRKLTTVDKKRFTFSQREQRKLLDDIADEIEGGGTDA